MPSSPISEYLPRLRQDFRTGSATERTYYGALQDLVEAVQPGVRAPFEQKRIDCLAIDFHVKHRDLTIGHIEAKDVGASLDEAEQTEQLKKRYIPGFPNLILTNYLEFRWYRNGAWQRTSMLGRVDAHGSIRSTGHAEDELRSLLKDFLAVAPQGAANAKDLATRLAHFAHEIRIVIGESLTQGRASSLITDLRDAVHKQLIPDLTDAQFADMFAQTLVYGFFAARCNHKAGPFQRLGAAGEIPKTNPFLRQLFEAITGLALNDEPFVGYVDDAIQLLDRTDMAGVLADFGRRTGRVDPVVHFYETFLKEYDPKLRELRGVYYTPEPVVSYMVRSVDHLLRTRFKCPAGLADTTSVTYQHETRDTSSGKAKAETITTPRVLVLDPALGTGTFLYAVVDLIRERFRQRRDAGMWSSYVREHLLPRLFGFEFLMAPYAVAHLKLGMQLAGQDLPEAQRDTWAYDFLGNERLGVFLTNTLDPGVMQQEPLPGPLRVIAEEANASAQIKGRKPIMVVIGNPPYSGHSANRSWETKNGKRVPTFIGRLLQDYYRVDGQPLGEKNPKWLQDDYVKFIRFGQWRIDQTARETGGGGILALVTNHSYLDNPTFRGMRQQLMQAFTDIYVLDLHGNTKKRERAPDGGKDENVFDIQQGVAIALFVKEPGVTGPRRVWHADLWGSRKPKYEVLAEGTCQTTAWCKMEPASPSYLFVPQGWPARPEYDGAWAVHTIFPVGSMGMNTHRDGLVIDVNRDRLLTRIGEFLDPSMTDAQAAEKSGVPLDRAQSARALLSSDSDWKARVIRCLYRPFDYRLLLYSAALIDRPRSAVNLHMLAENLSLVTTRQTREEFAAFATRSVCGQHKITATYDGSSFFPLYLYPGKKGQTIDRNQRIHEYVDAVGRAGRDYSQVAVLMRRLFPDPAYPRWPNLDPLFLGDLEERLGLHFIPDGSGDLTRTFGPEDVFDYIYSVLHSPTYRSRYAEFLKRDFPRIPFTSSRDLFAALVAKGGDLIALHLMESPLLDSPITSFPEPGSDKVERVAYNDNQRRVYINKTQYFDGVPKAVWEFHVGGYQVCEKWLKDRKGRKLDGDDLTHYKKIVVALHETIRLMAEIDALIPSWPIA